MRSANGVYEIARYPFIPESFRELHGNETVLTYHVSSLIDLIAASLSASSFTDYQKYLPLSRLS
tara:strand:+ start:318 stop:509 length:192 start_codon:yes stop_codon:yes gene_type:complete